MLENKSIGVVVPAHQEELLIRPTLETMPDYVDKIVVINDGSKDNTLKIIQDIATKDSRVYIINHEVNLGLGQSLINGYLKAREFNLDIIAVMGGDNQMHPDDLIDVVSPIASGQADYVKGNRLLRDEVTKKMPRHRYLGNSALTFLTKFATGYWSIIDPQCGYTAISLTAIKSIPIENMIKGYGYNADILHMLNIDNFKAMDVEVRPVYGREKSGIKLPSYIYNVSKLLVKLFIRRLTKKYLVREFNPLVFFYVASFFSLFCVSFPMLIRSLVLWAKMGELPEFAVMIFFFSSQFSLLFFFFAMWMDMEDNKKLCAK